VIVLFVSGGLLGGWFAWRIYDIAWHRGFEYGYSAGLLADDKLNITFEERE